MRLLAVFLAVVLADLAIGCGDDESGSTASAASGAAGAPGGCAAGEAILDDGGCLPAGTQPGGCAAGELALEDGGCQPAGPPTSTCKPGELEVGAACEPAGIAPTDCATGFVSDGEGGCEATLPAAPCPSGTMAIPGEASCRGIGSCGVGAFGDIPVDATTQFVDMSYAGGDGDGSAAKPWPTIQQGVDAAVSGAIVAVAAGSYGEDVTIAGKPIALWGRCAELVEIVGVGSSAAIAVGSGAGGTAIRDLAISGPGKGCSIRGSDVTIERAWIHDAGDFGVDATDESGAVALTLTDSLLEHDRGYSVYLAGVEATVERSVLRFGEPLLSNQSLGRGLRAEPGPTSALASTLALHDAVVEQNHDFGVLIDGSTAELAGVVIRDTLPSAAGGGFGRGLGIQDSKAGVPAEVTIAGSVVERSHEGGIAVIGSEVTVRTTVVRDTEPRASDGGLGTGIQLVNDAVPARATIEHSVVANNHYGGIVTTGGDLEVTATIVRGGLASKPEDQTGGGLLVQGSAMRRGSLEMSGSIVEDNTYVGILLGGSDATIVGTIVRKTLPASGTDHFGRGIDVGTSGALTEGSKFSLKSSLVEDNYENGVAVTGSDATIETSVVRTTKPRKSDGQFGHGVHAQPSEATGLPSSLVIRSSLVESNHGSGVLGAGSTVLIEGTIVKDTQPEGSSQNFGRGVDIEDLKQPADATVRGCVIEKNHDIGVFASGSTITIEGTLVRGTIPRPSDQRFGRGISIQNGTGQSRLRWSVIQQVFDMGVVSSGAPLEIESTLVKDVGVQTNDQSFGDGIFVEQTNASVLSSRVEGASRAGLANFGATVDVGRTALCAPIPLDGEKGLGKPFSYANLGDNECGCEPTIGACKAQTTNLAPPDVPEREEP